MQGVLSAADQASLHPHAIVALLMTGTGGFSKAFSSARSGELGVSVGQVEMA
jgi:hypothetical protein